MTTCTLEVPTLVLMCGGAGSGKTTLSDELVKIVENSFYIDKDTINATLRLTVDTSDTLD